MAKFEAKLKAVDLRRKGWSIRSIAKELSVSKGSVGIWCREIILTPEQNYLIAKNALEKNAKGRLIGAVMNRQKRLNLIQKFAEDGSKEIGCISKRELLLIGAALYWAEGSKTEPRFIFVNSNPDMVQVIYKLLLDVINTPKENIRVGIQINKVHFYRINEVLNFWSKLLNLPTSQFDRPYYVNVVPKKIYENMDIYYGTVRLRVLKGSNLQYRFLGLIKAIIKSTNNMSG